MKWNGTTSSALGSGTGGTIHEVNALTVWKNALYVGGSFTQAGGVTNDCGMDISMGAELLICVHQDYDRDGDVDLADFAVFQGCFNGPNRPPACD